MTMRPTTQLAIIIAAMLFALGCSENGTRLQTTEDSALSRISTSQVDHFVGIWRWAYADGATYHMELMRSGNARMYRGLNVISRSGSWSSPDGETLIVELENLDASQQVCHKGSRPHDKLIAALLKKTIRRFETDENDEDELMEVAVLPSGADFPWAKVDRVAESLIE